MKKILLTLLILLGISLAASAQIMGTSKILKPRQFSLGIEPGIYATGGADFNLFLHGGVGLTKGTDLSVKVGFLGSAVYIGGDVEFGRGPFSFAVGAHSYGSFGLDFTGLVTLPLANVARIYTGLDVDVNFPGDNLSIPVWIPLGLQIPLQRRMLFHFETEINLTSAGNSYIGAGVNFIL